MKIRLDYKPWKITVDAAYRQNKEGKDDAIPIRTGPGVDSVAAAIYAGVRSWRRFPVSFGDAGTPDAESVFVLLDRIQTPISLLDPQYSTVATAKRCKPSELPRSLRDLYQHLVALGHAQPNVETDTETEGKRA